jgi:hypothetical protein
MRNLFILLVLFCFVECNNSSNTIEAPEKDTAVTTQKKDSSLNYIHKFTDTALENRVIEELMKLSFVKKTNAYIDSFSNHRYGIAFMVDSVGENKNEISVHGGYNGDLRFETYYLFYVNPNTLEIKVYDALTDKKLSVGDYLKTQK